MRLFGFVTILISGLFTSSVGLTDEVPPMADPIGNYEICHERLEREMVGRCINHLQETARTLGLTVTIRFEQRTNGRGEATAVSIGTFSNNRVCDCVNPNDYNCK